MRKLALFAAVFALPFGGAAVLLYALLQLVKSREYPDRSSAWLRQAARENRFIPLEVVESAASNSHPRIHSDR